MDGEESLPDSIFYAENAEDTEDIDMVDVEEGELVGNNQQVDGSVQIRQSSSKDGDALTQEPQTRNPKRKNKKKKKKKGGSGANVTDINRFVLDTCRRLKERKSYLIWTAVGCLGVPALSDLVKEICLPKAILSMSIWILELTFLLDVYYFIIAYCSFIAWWMQFKLAVVRKPLMEAV
ncbi:uncharacterized protein LOC143530013 [Bidens hawaiensis]|uniref:uncharacterized protein LOC143530013 n=1 Tax=Bidens hawaiensis TaxID=980011 RepID=UPI00404B80CE